jgi:hypothetical protein
MCFIGSASVPAQWFLMVSIMARKFSMGVSSWTWWVGPMIRPPPLPSVSRRLTTSLRTSAGVPKGSVCCSSIDPQKQSFSPYSLQPDGRAPGPKALVLVWNLKPGESRTGWIVRPYRAYAADLPGLRQRNWSQEVEIAKQEWHALLDRAAQFQVPDAGVANSFRACLADLYIMRESVAGGFIAAVPGTEVYRAANSFEAAIVTVALDQMGLQGDAEKGYRVCLEMQEPDGNWADPKGWGHLMWGGLRLQGMGRRGALPPDR